MSLVENKDEYDKVFVDELELSVRSSNALHRAGVNTLHQLIDIYNKGELLKIKNLGKGSFDEIETRICEIDIKPRVIEGHPANESKLVKEYVIPEELEDISIADLRLNIRQFNCLKRGGINTVGDLLRMNLSDFMGLHGAGTGTVEGVRKIISELKERGIAYFDDIRPENEPIDEQRLRTFDIETAKKLRDEFDFKPIILAEWYGVTRQRAYQMMEQRSQRGNWLNRIFGEKEDNLLAEMLENRTYFAESAGGQKAYLYNNKKDDCALVFVDDEEIKCFYLNMLPEGVRTKIIEKRMECLTEEELEVAACGKRVFVLRQEFYLPDNSAKFRTLADARGMTSAEYCLFLTGLPITTNQTTVTDEKILEFLHAHYVDGRLMIPANNSTVWFRTFISRHGYSIDDIAKLYEIENDVESENEEYDVNSVEDDMRDYGESDSWINTLYAQNPLIGNKRISDNNKEKLYKITKKYIDQILREPLVKVPITAKMQITLMVITFAKEWVSSDEGGFWYYITTQFGYRDDTGRLRGILCDYVLESMQKNHRWFVSTASGYQYKSTIVAHALSTKRSWMRLYDFLFDFYKNNMDWTYVEDDPIVHRMVEALKNKLVAGDEANEDNLEISNNVYTFQEGIRKLVIYRTRYAVNLISHMLHRIDDTVNHLETPPQIYVDELCDIWMEERISGTSESRTREATGRKRNVAVDYTRIRPVYSLINETDVKILFPDIRLKRTEFECVELTIYAGGKEIENRTLNYYGNELGKTISEFEISVDKCLRNGDGTLRIRTLLKCDNEVIFDSADSLFRDLLCFSGEREINVSSCEKSAYSFFVPTGKKLDFIGAEVSEIPAGNVYDASFVRFEDGFVIRMNDNVLAFDETSTSGCAGIRVVLPKIKKGIAYINNGKKYDVIDEIGTVNIVVDKDYDYKRSRIIMNGNQLSLLDYDEEEVGNGRLYRVPIVVRNNHTCDFEVVDLENNRISSRAALFYKESFTWRFNKNTYYSSDDYENSSIRIFNGQKMFVERLNPDEEYVSISTGDGVFEIRIPKISIRDGSGEIWECGRWFWIKEFDQTDKVYISAPDNCEIKLSLGNVDVVEEVKNTYSLGNAVFALSAIDSNELVDIVLNISVNGENKTYSLGKISQVERFMTPPKFDYKEGRLYWNKGTKFIGDKEADIRLIVSSANEERSYLLNLEDNLIQAEIDLPLGEYSFRIVKEAANLFSITEEELATGTLVIGDKDALRFKNSIIRITHITNEDGGELQSVEIRGTYIENIEYQGIQYVGSEERECPVYMGSMFFMGQSGKHHAFSDEEMETEEGYSVYKVNPVRIVYINEHTLSITNESGEGIYYYRYFNRDKMTNMYLVTDREPDARNQNNYNVADLYLYKKEIIENV